MELAICKTELPPNKFMLPTSSASAAFYEKSHQTAHFNDILSFPSNYLFNKSPSTSTTSSSYNINNSNSNNNNNSTNNNCDNFNIPLISPSTSSTMRLKKNRKVTFLSNLIETKNIFIKEEPIDGSKAVCSISDISDHEASLDVPTQIPPLTPGTNRKVAEVLKASFASWEKEVQNCNITKDPREWSEEHVIYWLNWAIKEFSLVTMNHEPFIKMKGRDIIELGKDKFLAITPAFTGDILWEHLDILQKDCEKPLDECNVNTNNSYETSTTGSVCGSDHQVGFSNSNNDNNSNNNNSNNNNSNSTTNTNNNNSNNTNTTNNNSNSNNNNNNSRLTPQDFNTSATSSTSSSSSSSSATNGTTITTTANSDKTATTTSSSTTTGQQQQQHHSDDSSSNQLALDVKKMLSRQSIGNSLRTFDGSSKFEWPAFISEYTLSSNLCQFSNEENILRLNNCLKGDARRYVEMLLITSKDPSDILDILSSVYGKQEEIANELLSKARQIKSFTECSSFQEFEINTRNIISALNNVEPQYRREKDILQILVSKLPQHLIIQWGSYLLSQSQILEQSSNNLNQILQPNPSNHSKNLFIFKDWVRNLSNIFTQIGIQQKVDEKPKYSQLQQKVDERAKYSQPPLSCHVCKSENHTLTLCPTFTSSSISVRWDLAKEARVCYCCLKRHSGQCKERKQCAVNNCSRFHHQMLHKISEENANLNLTTRTVTSNKESEKEIVLLKMLPVKLWGPNGCKIVTAFLDEGSNVSLIDASIASELGFDGPVKPLCLNWTGEINRYDSESKNLSVALSSSNPRSKIFTLENVRSVTDLDLPGQNIDLKEILKKFPYSSNVDLQNMNWSSPKILIGQDNASLIVTLQYIQPDPNSLILSKTRLGWSIHGTTKHKINTQPILSTSMCNVCDKDLHELVQGQFQLENIPVAKTNDTYSEDDKDCIFQVEKSIKYVGDRFEVKFPWKNNENFPNTYPLALSRFKCLVRKIQNDNIEDAYSKEIKKLLDKGYASPVDKCELDGKRIWYLPHFAVINPKKPGKIRVVFDAAAKVSGKCLNDYLHSGPDLLTSIFGTLIHFRTFKYGFVGDVREMFNQIQIEYNDSFAQCFLWKSENIEDEPKVFRMRAMLFGITSAPFLSQYVKNFNADRFLETYPEAVKAIKEYTYVDDFIYGKNDENEAIKVFNDVIKIQAAGGFELRNCISNSRAIVESIPNHLVSEKYKFDIGAKIPNQSVLGIKWDAVSDKLEFNMYFLSNCDEVFTNNHQNIPTKRQILKAVMSIFDPLGILSPITIKGKMIVQDIWRSGVGWDDQISKICFKEWLKFCNFVYDMQSIQIERWYSQLLIDCDQIDIHVFCDASELGYATAIYIKIWKGSETDSVLVAAKARVAPIKTISIPKLELMAAVLGVRLYNNVKQHIGLRFKNCYFWTDSSAVIGWIKSNKKLPTFVSNRVLEISQLSNINDWFWVPTNYNVADICTRGQMKVPLSQNNIWFRGPKFIRNFHIEIPEQPQLQSHNSDVCMVTKIVPQLFEIKWNYSYVKILRVTARVLRFIKGCKGEFFVNNDISVTDLERSLIMWIKRVQEHMFPVDIQNISNSKPNVTGRLNKHTIYIDSNGLLRIKNRILDNSIVELEDPICLDGKHEFVKKLVLHYHNKSNHQFTDAVINELRKKYYIPNIRSNVKSVIYNCYTCKRLKCKASNPLMACLPSDRLLVHQKPFTAVGVDYFGPYLVKIGRRVEKRYGCLFICLTTRAIHIEIVHSLTADSCLLAIRRLVARRGEIKKIWSDNGKYFLSASRELRQAKEDINFTLIKESLTKHNIDWIFIPPYSPHMGGSWERLIGCFKRCIDIVLRGSSVKEETLQTVFAEAEYIVNSRPLFYVGSDSEKRALTPNDIIIGQNAKVPLNGSPSGFQRMWRVTQNIIDMFWCRWIKEYLPTVSLRTKWTQSTPTLKEGDIVVISNEKVPRYHWPIGVIKNLNYGPDGIARSCLIKTSQGDVKRSVHQLCHFIQDGGSSCTGENVAAAPCT